MCLSVLKQYVSQVAERWTCLTCEHRLTLETSCDCICEEAVGQPEELPALFCAVDACCVGITWRARSIVWKEDVPCCVSGQGNAAYDARKLSLVGSGSEKSALALSQDLTWPEMVRDKSLLSSGKDGLQLHLCFKRLLCCKCRVYNVWLEKLIVSKMW